MRTMARPNGFEGVVLLLLLVSISYQLFMEPIVGMANNADFARLILPAGIGYHSSSDYWETVFKFSETKFEYVPPRPFRYLTSQRPILGAAVLLNRLFAKDGHFHLVAMGASNLALYLLALFAFLASFRRKPRSSRLLVAGAVLLICPDVKWVSYFNSFYSESASLVFLFATVGFALLRLNRGDDDREALLTWFGYLVSAVLFWMAKAQNAAFVPCLALGAWFLSPNALLKSGRIAGTIALPACMLWAFATNQYADTTGENVRVVTQEEILRHSPAPEKDRTELGLDTGKGSLFGIARFYMKHPSRWWAMTQRQSREAFDYIPYGNFSRVAGLGPGAQSRAFNTWSEWKKARFPRNVFVWGVVVLAMWGLAVVKMRCFDRSRRERLRSLVAPVLAVGCLLEFVVCTTFEANGTAKHLFIFNVAVDISLLLTLISLLEILAAARRRRYARNGVANTTPDRAATS